MTFPPIYGAIDEIIHFLSACRLCTPIETFEGWGADGIKYVVEACRVLGLKQLGLAYQAAINYKVEAKEKSEDDDIYCMLDAGCWMLLKASQSFISTSNTPKWFRLFERIMNYFWFNL
ncbi:MAG: hypothetical protein IPM78_12745 [Moraxellaceae bacterium]|nr:hypothetical protein [Moraxellaceae bacterium]